MQKKTGEAAEEGEKFSPPFPENQNGARWYVMVRGAGVEPASLAAKDSKSFVSAISPAAPGRPEEEERSAILYSFQGENQIRELFFPF